MNSARKLWVRFGVTLSEPSTWRGFVMLLTAVGVQLDPEQQNAVIVFGLAAAGLIGVFFKSETNPAPVLQSERDRELNQAESLSDVVSGTRK